MSLIKKVDVPAYFAARRAMRRRVIPSLFPSPARAGAAVDPFDAKASAARIAEDFSLEHDASPVIVPPQA
jgi:hypothetical protein